eukprot:3628382-Ditylum_brightwellii.AAC.2
MSLGSFVPKEKHHQLNKEKIINAYKAALENTCNLAKKLEQVRHHPEYHNVVDAFGLLKFRGNSSLQSSRSVLIKNYTRVLEK